MNWYNNVGVVFEIMKRFKTQKIMILFTLIQEITLVKPAPRVDHLKQ